ncbi:hypothetical protein Cgig2_006676 [Carnegiea gigantea]|uniref:DUF8040 domain-containing protein n=1 Tax=Carnegiea gigantea TaxID=171969 RepID=A0A9Q1GR69_9CARY|nr:hypothetical protein Cgig2_006676 [Carnegiea gigantea]
MNREIEPGASIKVAPAAAKGVIVVWRVWIKPLENAGMLEASSSPLYSLSRSLMANDLNEEEAVVIGATASFLGATAALLRNHNNKDIDNETRIPQIPRQPFVNGNVDRENYINSVLYCGGTHSLNQIRMRPGPFFELCEMIERRALLVNAKHMSVREQVLMFLHLIGHNVRFRAIGGSSFVAAPDMISKKFNVKCLSDRVGNHLRTVKTAWVIIAKLRSQSGCGWDENMMMIRMSPDVCNTYVEVNATHEKYLNKKIDMYNEMAIVVGKNVARGSGAKSFDAVQI